MPPLLELGLNCEQYQALPYSGGVMEQPAGLMTKIRKVMNIYHAFKIWTAQGQKPGEVAKWKKEIPELPELNFDNSPQKSYEEIKDLNPSIYRNLFSNSAVVKEIFPILFPEKLTLKYLKDYFHSQESKIYQNLYKSLSDIINDLIYLP